MPANNIPSMTMDERWSIFDHTCSLAEFEHHYIFTERLTPTSNKMLLDYERLILQLLKLSYYEYELITIAMKQVFVLAELVFRSIDEKNTGNKCKQNLSTLIVKFHNAGILSQREFDKWQNVRELRNHFTHPDNYYVHSPAAIGTIKKVIISINDLTGKV